MTSNDPLAAVPVLSHQVYADELRTHAVTLIWMGFQRLNATSLTHSEEDDITGELVREMKCVIQDPSSPVWVDHYHVQEQILKNINDKRGKRRPKMDIEFERSGRGDRPILGFEAKRLGRGNNAGTYLGEEGLTAFVNGYYPTTHGEAGMLGYVQERTPEAWSTKLANRLKPDAAEFQVTRDGGWHSMDMDAAFPASRTFHTDTQGRSLSIIHVLLAFT